MKMGGTDYVTYTHTHTDIHTNAHISLEYIFQFHSNTWQNSLLLGPTGGWKTLHCDDQHSAEEVTHLEKPAKIDSLHLQRTL